MKSVEKATSSVGSPLSERLMAGIGAARSDGKRPDEIPLNGIEYGIRAAGILFDKVWCCRFARRVRAQGFGMLKISGNAIRHQHLTFPASAFTS